jgi:hypothetical protein
MCSTWMLCLNLHGSAVQFWRWFGEQFPRHSSINETGSKNFPDTFLWNVRSTELQCITRKKTRQSFRDIKRNVFIGCVWHGPPCITVYSITQCWVGCGMTYLVQKSMYCFVVEAVVAAAPTTSVFLTPRHRPTEGASCEINPFWSDRQFLRVQFEEIHGCIILCFPLPSIVIIRQHLHG